MAMTFTLVSHLRESLSSLVITRAEKREKEERERERIALEVAKRTSMTTCSRPLTFHPGRKGQNSRNTCHGEDI
jgi:hypothetical protein